jgi:hypothetical protein
MSAAKKIKGNVYSYFTLDEGSGKGICNIVDCAAKISVGLEN